MARATMEVDVTKGGLSTVDVAGRFVDPRTVLLKSTGSTVMKGRFVNADGRSFPMKSGANSGHSTFTITITAEQGLLAALVAAGYVWDNMISAIIFSTSGSDMYYNTSCKVNGLVDAGHLDGSIDPNFDSYVPSGSRSIVIGRARTAIGASGATTSSSGSSSSSPAVIGTAQNAVVAMSAAPDVVVPTAFYANGVMIEVVNITVSATPHALATQYATAMSGTPMPSNYDGAKMFPPTSAGSVSLYVNYSYNGSSILVAPSAAISTPYAMGVGVPIGRIPDGDLPTNIVGTTDVDTPFVIIYSNVKTGTFDIPSSGYKQCTIRPQATLVTCNVKVNGLFYSGGVSASISYDWHRDSGSVSEAPIVPGGRSIATTDTISFPIDGAVICRVTIPVTASDGQSFEVALSRSLRVREAGQLVTSDSDFADQGFRLKGRIGFYGEQAANNWYRMRGHKNSTGVPFSSRAAPSTVALAASFSSQVIKASYGILASVLITTVGAGSVIFYDTPNSTISGKKIIGKILAGAAETGVPIIFDMTGLTGIWAEVSGVAPAITVGYH